MNNGHKIWQLLNLRDQAKSSKDYAMSSQACAAFAAFILKHIHCALTSPS